MSGDDERDDLRDMVLGLLGLVVEGGMVVGCSLVHEELDLLGWFRSGC